ncbi:MAG TPA: nucleotide sugar dehydrogenase [Candidatus Thalassarchaeaceae archaeon]|nr:MAG TPA: nucleotide sugar dehydrogenase [Candidatus Poseidoniales archaeon]HIH83906.1 nucleotide sugar dehydrogenase [Candidatus Thalassarchaeaceae archaeon]
MLTTDRIKALDLTIGVVGLGYVGLPTALGFHDAGFRVHGLDVSERVISELQAGRNPGDDPAFDNAIPNDERWTVTTEPKIVIPECDVILVTVPTPVLENKRPDLRFIQAAGETIFDHIDRGKRPVVVLESTVYPGVTREIWSPLIESRGLSEGVDLDLAYCPERFVPGDPNHGVRQVPRVVGATDTDIVKALAELYSHLTEGTVTPVSSIEVAEAAKVVENVQRDLNIALVNELALIFPEIGLDVEEVLTAAATKWNFHRYTPGIGVGGHCIPVDPYYLIQKAHSAGAPVELITSAREVNATMPKQVATRIIRQTSDLGRSPSSLKILLLGWSYKPGIADARETPSESLANELVEQGCEIYVWDPHIQAEHRLDGPYIWVDQPETSKPDVVILCTAHEEILGLDWTALRKSSDLGFLYDGRRVLDVEILHDAGWITGAVGRP